MSDEKRPSATWFVVCKDGYVLHEPHPTAERAMAHAWRQDDLKAGCGPHRIWLPRESVTKTPSPGGAT